ncbi:ATP-binding cassette domain-containing protein [Amycolatopsis suaedae]|uniref:ATP-binding cassette domain-containing protein n=1 Tax=Amycolatopsis suaedae TaxID=2510978 RepID=A0A4Q7J6F4_9PSEU|nr:ATP-binding cassette domain-containing protein [Amycolatopsis suaedae]RZQ63201.1 ATP-binding cassette domain-containing protein [Amycolatopsis suaedae]
MGTPQTEPIVTARGLRKRFGTTQALDGLDLSIPAGTVYGLLGPNGAGKSTAVRVLATLTRPDEGSAVVAGHDVVRHADEVRRKIGLAGQHAALDQELTGRENLRIFGKLFHLSGRQARARADELLERFDLADAGDRQVKTYSGGMRRRLDLISSLIISPTVLFLDEPTTGLDPRSRTEIWETVRRLVADGTTVLLTTQYLDEADQLADNIAVIDHGKVIAEGSPAELKSRIGGRIDVVVGPETDLGKAAVELAAVTGTEPDTDPDERRLSAPTGDEAVSLAAVLRRMDQAGVDVEDIGKRTPTLDEVFLELTRKPAKEVRR